MELDIPKKLVISMSVPIYNLFHAGRADSDKMKTF